MIKSPHASFLDDYYAGKAGEASKYLSKYYDAEVCEKSNSDHKKIASLNKQSIRTILRLPSKVENLDIDLLVVLFWSFPDRLPKIYLSDASLREIPPLSIPHLDKDGFFCTRDPEITYINSSKPGEGVAELVHVAIDEIGAGVTGRNTEHFGDEFIAYWNQNASEGCFTLFEVDQEPKPLTLYKTTDAINKNRCFLSDDETRVADWARFYGGAYESIKSPE